MGGNFGRKFWEENMGGTYWRKNWEREIELEFAGEFGNEFGVNWELPENEKSWIKISMVALILSNPMLFLNSLRVSSFVLILH